jgi:alpha-beta hydrolase superfamily lysophospholipase
VVFALCASGRASAATQELTLRMNDGVDLAATLYEPDAAPPPAGYPTVVLFHGLAGKRQDLAALAQRLDGQFAVLAFDARGHGQSGGLTSISGPREVTDARAVFQQLAARSDIDDAKIGAWGMSMGAGTVLRSLVDGVPWAAVEVAEAWTNLYSALAPQNLAKSGAIFQFLSSVPADRLDPSVAAIRDDALASRNLSVLRAWADARSSRKLLSNVRTPLFFFQGRRDFAFDVTQAKVGYALVKGPKRLYIGDFGHAPSTFPGPDFSHLATLGLEWFQRYLVGASPSIAQVALAPNPWHGKPRTYESLPPTRRLSIALSGTDRLAGAGRALRTSGRFHRPRRDLRLRDGARDREALRRLVAARGRADRAAAEGQGGRRDRGRRQHGRPLGRAQARHPPDRHRHRDPEGRAPALDARLELARAEPREPALPEPADAPNRPASRSGRRS